MAINEAENGDVLVISCKYCGTQSHFKSNEFSGDEALKCRACGAQLEAAPPPKARGKRKKIKRAFGRLIDDPVWGKYWRERRTDYVEAVGKAIAVIILIAALFVLALLYIGPFTCD
jgi:hypothetical protein